MSQAKLLFMEPKMKESRSLVALMPLKFLVLALCVIGFVTVTYQQVVKFIRRERTTVRFVEQVKQSRFPVVLFCRKTKLFTVPDDVNNSAILMLNKAQYDNYSNDIKVRCLIDH